MTNQTAYITGGSSGIGFAIARALLERGWRVSICARSQKTLARASSDLMKVAKRGTDDLHAAPADVSSAADVGRWVTEADERLGPPGLLVNSAGIGLWKRIASLSEAEWERVLDVNLKGAFLCVREILPSMRKAGGGYIVNIASISGKKGMASSSAYCASKFGMVGFTESLIAEEKANNIRATSICPGYVATPMVEGADVPPSEMIQTEDIVATVLYLLELTPKVVIREIVIERVGA